MTCSSQDLLSYCTFIVINRVPFWTLKISLCYCDVMFVPISASLLGRSNVYDTSSCINKGYKNSLCQKQIAMSIFWQECTFWPQIAWCHSWQMCLIDYSHQSLSGSSPSPIKLINQMQILLCLVSSVLDSSMFSWTVGDSFHLHLHSQPHVQQIPVTPAGKRSGRSAFSSHEGGLKTDGLYWFKINITALDRLHSS